MKAEQCRSETKRGTRCSALAVPGDDRCAWHTELPEWVAKRSQWSAEGGKKRSNAERAKKALPAEPLSIAELHAFLGVVFRRVVTGQTEPGVATAAATVARTMAELQKASDYESRLTDLERRLTGRAS
jgi:hypothetical protein